MIFTSIYQRIKENKPLYFRFWANCILVKGYKNGILFDLQRGRSVNVSRLFCETYERYKGECIGSAFKDKNFEERKGYFKMLDFFIKNDFGILTDDVNTLPDLSMEYDSPFWATNVVLETDSDADPSFMFDVIEKLSQGHVEAVQVNDYGHIMIQQLKRIGEITINSQLHYIYIYTNYQTAYSRKQLNFIYGNNRFRNIIFMGAPRERDFNNEEMGLANIVYTKKMLDFKCCGNVRKDLFVFNQPFFIEAHSCNTCLNRKISIDKNGVIRNCPLMGNGFGKIQDYSIKEIVYLPGFQKLWNLSKDAIDVCKDCEYRYICTDCRHFIKDKDNIKSQPSKCRYNPYIGKWEGESGYVSVEECGKYSQNTGYIPNEDIICELNKRIENTK